MASVKLARTLNVRQGITVNQTSLSDPPPPPLPGQVPCSQGEVFDRKKNTPQPTRDLLSLPLLLRTYCQGLCSTNRVQRVAERLTRASQLFTQDLPASQRENIVNQEKLDSMARGQRMSQPGARRCVKAHLVENLVPRYVQQTTYRGTQKAYVVIDDQSNCSLAKQKLFDLLCLEGEATSYTLKTCSGTTQARGRRGGVQTI